MANKSYEFISKLIQEKQIKISNLEASFLDNLKVSTLEIYDLHISQLASMFYMSNASISRFSQKLGFSGYQELKYAIQSSDSSFKSITKNRYFDLLKLSPDLDEKTKLFLNNIEKYNKILIVGLESNGLVALEFKIKLERIGLKNIDYAIEPMKIDMLSSSLSSNDLMIVLALDGNNQSILRFSEHCYLNSVDILSISESKDSRLKKYSKIYLTTPYQREYLYNISKMIPLLLYIDLICEYIKLNVKK